MFIDSGSALVAEQLAAVPSYDWLLVDAQHSPLTPHHLQALLTAISVHSRPSLVRVGGPDDRIGAQTQLALATGGILGQQPID